MKLIYVHIVGLYTISIKNTAKIVYHCLYKLPPYQGSLVIYGTSGFALRIYGGSVFRLVGKNAYNHPQT